jgi:hypothetical protein
MKNYKTTETFARSKKPDSDMPGKAVMSIYGRLAGQSTP